MLGGKASSAGTGAITSRDGQRQAFLLLSDYERSGLGWFWSTDPEGRIVYISEAIATMLGKPRDELVGQPFHSLFTLERNEHDQVERTLPLVFSAHKTFSELPVRAATADTEVWWAISGRPQLTGNGDFLGFLGNGSDVATAIAVTTDGSVYVSGTSTATNGLLEITTIKYVQYQPIACSSCHDQHFEKSF